MTAPVAKLPNAVAIFRFPNKNKVHTIQGKARTLKSNESVENGFVFSSFDGQERYVIEANKKSTEDFHFPKKKNVASTPQVAFLKSVANIQKAIQQNRFSKVVTAKIQAIDTPENFNLFSLFSKALNKYPEAFVCLVMIDNKVCWLCASPELLLKTNSKAVKTFSLAGTIKEGEAFSEKETEEQQIVTDAIIASLAKFKELKRAKAKKDILQNGHLQHLLTLIKAEKKEEIDWSKIANELHPTPAVGSFPKENGIAFIQKNESFDRRFYSGFLGQIKNGKAKLYVNLRCMEITEKQLVFYAGCGITAASDAKKEWQETEHKLDILRSLI